MALSLLEAAKAISGWVVAQRRYFHQHPELSLEEHNTSQYAQKILAELGYEVKTIWQTGFVADLNLKKQHTIAFRADMDALPIHELNEYDFASAKQGVSHMCGHDGHMAIVLGAARIFAENKQQLNSNIRILFQPSEEVFPGGAKSMIANGALSGVDEIYALHNDPLLPTGKIKCLEGPMTANCDTFEVIVRGKGGHGAAPQDALDPIFATASIVMELQAVRSRLLSPFHPGVVGVCTLKAGEAINVIPEQAEFSGIIRTFFPEDRTLARQAVTNIIKNKESLGYKCEINLQESYPSIINKPEGKEKIVAAASKILASENIITNGYPEAWGEDFAYYLEHKPGGFFILGSGDPKREVNHPLHSPHYNFDEEALNYGVAIIAEIAMAFR